MYVSFIFVYYNFYESVYISYFQNLKKICASLSRCINATNANSEHRNLWDDRVSSEIEKLWIANKQSFHYRSVEKWPNLSVFNGSCIILGLDPKCILINEIE